MQLRIAVSTNKSTEYWGYTVGKSDDRQNTVPHTGCPRRNGQNFGRVFLMLNYTDITQNTYIQS